MLQQNPADHFSGPALEMAQAVRRKDLSGLESLTRTYPEAVKSAGSGGTPLLVWAMGHDDPAATAVLLNAGASPNVTFPYGNWKMSALSLAAGAENPRYLDLLLAHRADPGGMPETEPPLFTAIKSGRADRIPVLVKAGADLNQQDSAGKAAVHVAALAGDYRMAASLVNMGANPRLPMKNGVTLKSIIEKFPLAAGHPQYAAQAELAARLR